jgi:hypothetical protein
MKYDKCRTSRPAIDKPAQLGVEGDGAIEQQFGGCRMLEMTCKHERFVHGGEIVRIRIKARANAIDVAKSGKKFERSGKQASAMKEIDQPLCAGTDEAIAHRRGNDCPGIKQEFGACPAREVLLAERVTAVAEGTGRHPSRPRQSSSPSSSGEFHEAPVHDNNAGYSAMRCRSSSTSLSWMMRRASDTAHSSPLPRRWFTSLSNSFQPSNPYSRASAN